MDWKKDREWRTGEAHVLIDGTDTPCQFVIGNTVTGKQKVFHSNFIFVQLPSGEEMRGEDSYTVRGALVALSDALAAQSINLIAVGLRDDFYETGLSHNSGIGYVVDYPEPIHMMACNTLSFPSYIDIQESCIEVFGIPILE